MTDPSSPLDRFRRDETGGALVEFAIVLPLLLTLIFGIIGWGISLSMHNAMYDTARACARAVAIGVVDPATAEESAACTVNDWPADFTVTAQLTNGLAQVSVETPNPLATALPFITMPRDLSADVTLPAEAAGLDEGNEEQPPVVPPTPEPEPDPDQDDYDDDDDDEDDNDNDDDEEWDGGGPPPWAGGPNR